MGLDLKQMFTPPKSIRKFQPKKLGNVSWWKDFTGEVALPAAGLATGAGLLGAGPLAGLLGGVGSSIGGAASGALGKLGSLGSAGKGLLDKFGGIGGGAMDLLGGDLGKLLGGAIGGKMTYDAYKQSGEDSKMARNLAGESLDMYRQAAQGAQDRYNMNSPLRDAFRMGAMNFSDPSNPFSRGQEMFQPFQDQLQFEGAGPGAPTPGGGTPGAMPPTTRTDPPGGGQVIPGGILAGQGMPSGGFMGGAMGGITQQMDPQGALMQALMGTQGGGRNTSTPSNRTASVKGSRVAQKQDRGRDRKEMER